MSDDDGTQTVDNTEAWRSQRQVAEGAQPPESPAYLDPGQRASWCVAKDCRATAEHSWPRIARPWRWPIFEWLRRIHAGPWRWMRSTRGAKRLCLDHYEEAQDRVDCKLQQLRCTQAQNNLKAGNEVRSFNRTGLVKDMGESGKP